MSSRFWTVARQSAGGIRRLLRQPSILVSLGQGSSLPINHSPLRRHWATLSNQPQRWEPILTTAATTSSVLGNVCRNFSTHSLDGDYLEHRAAMGKEIQSLPEVQAVKALEGFLQDRCDNTDITAPQPPVGGYSNLPSPLEHAWAVDAALLTFVLHVESRIAALLGRGFYTIGPCGEEALAAAGLLLQGQDAAALHYRHLAINLARQLQESVTNVEGEDSYSELLEQLALDRARGYCVSKLDPVTGGVHCSIGSGPPTNPRPFAGGDYIVTSTLASQCSAAVGRALGYSLLPQQQQQQSESHGRPLSFVTLGDGSAHNHHFWSAFHLARHARHNRKKCPVLFGISDNGLSISYKTKGYVDTLFEHDPLIPLFQANGNDLLDVYQVTKQAMEYVRRHQAPAVIVYKELTRRFGHAATDRQFAYLEEDEIQSMAELDLLERMILQAVEHGVTSYADLQGRLSQLKAMVQSAFAQASSEPKVTREDMMERVASPLVPVPRLPAELTTVALDDTSTVKGGRRQVMRKHMTRVLREALEQHSNAVYMGEDVQHGGYYTITEGLAEQFPGRVLDFPPDETSLIGAAMGFSQLGLLPICEIPYAKYLDCGADAFYELVICNQWLSNGEARNGLILRLQGFGAGLFGGNFHTHNMLQHMPPGLHVVCYSNGRDYVRGFRHAVHQAKDAGAVTMLVDCTNLLNLRHLHNKDRGWEFEYPEDEHFMSFDEVIRYGSKEAAPLAIVTYGSGVVTALRARQQLVDAGVVESLDQVDVLDCPHVSAVPQSLADHSKQYKALVFADICKSGPGSSVLSSTVCELQRRQSLPTIWQVVEAPRTYNPLGSMCTFLSENVIASAVERALKRL